MNAPGGRPVRDVVIAGGGVCGWIAALGLSRAFAGKPVAVRVVETPGADLGLGPVGPAISARPAFLRHLAAAGLSEAWVLAASAGAYTLGTARTGWHVPDATAFLSFGDVGAPLGTVAFHQLAHRLRSEGRPVRLADHGVAAVAAQGERFAHPLDDPRSILSSYEYGASFDAGALAGALRGVAKAGGVTAHAGAIAEVVVEDGLVSALVLEGGERVGGDLFLDCTGPGAGLAGAVGAGFDDWSHWLPCDRALFAARRDPHPPLPFTHAGAHAAGWRLSVPVDGGLGEALFYASGAMTDDAAAAMLGVADIRPLAFRAGRRSRLWQGNVVALGAAAAMLEPLDPIALDLLVADVDRIVALFPATAGDRATSAEYDRQAGNAIAGARDFLMTPYRLNGRRGAPFWDAARAVAPPEGLAHKFALFASRGVVPMYDDEPFDADAWVQHLDATGLVPRRRDAMTDAIPAERLHAHVDRLSAMVAAAARSLPTHADYLARIKSGLNRKNAS